MIHATVQKLNLGSSRRSGFVRLTILAAILHCLFSAAAVTAQEKPAANGAFETLNTVAPLSLSLNGTNAYMTVPDSQSLNLTGALTLEAWIKSADYSASQPLIERFSQNLQQGGYGLRVGNGAVTFTICPPRGRCANASSAPTLAPNQWQHIAAVYDGSEMRVYLNGRRSGSGRSINGVQSPGAVSGAMKIGTNASQALMFQGLLDEIRVSNAALYTTNFSPSAQTVSGVNTAGLWRFDGGSFNDTSPNNNHAMMTGGANFSPDVPDALADGFRITPTPNVGPSNILNSVKAISPTEAWAVGNNGPKDRCCFPKAPVSLRWDGSQWINVPVPLPPGFSEGSLVAVDATSPTNVWAVGTVGNNASERVVLLRWNGTNWNIAAVAADPSPSAYGISSIKSITVISENDVWLVGSQTNSYSWTLHWDGNSLQTVPSPNLDNGNNLNDIDAINANDIWAVGAYMVIRWNGTAWATVPSAPRGAQYSSVAAIAPNDVWTIAGYTQCPPIGGCVSSVGLLHFDGTQWIPVSPPGVTGQLFLEEVSASASNDVWVVGSDTNKTYVAHFDGTSWQRVASESSPTSQSDLDRLKSVSPLNANEVWTVGFASEFFYNPQGNITYTNNLALRYSAIP